MNRDDYVSVSRLLVSAGYASGTLVSGDQIHFELTWLGQTRLRELFCHLHQLPKPGSCGRVEAILEVLLEMKALSPSEDEIEALVAISLDFRRS